MKPSPRMFTALALIAATAALGCQKQAVKVEPRTFNGANESPATDERRLKEAQAFASLLAREQFEAAAGMFEPALAQAMDAQKLEIRWRASEKRRGAFRKIREVREQPDARGVSVLVTCEFQKAVVNLQVRFGSTGRVLSFFLHSD